MQEAVAKLETWKPLDPTSPSRTERTVLYHRDLTPGKLRQYQGSFLAASEWRNLSVWPKGKVNSTSFDAIPCAVRPMLAPKCMTLMAQDRGSKPKLTV